MQIVKPPSTNPIPQKAKKVFTGVIFDVYQWQQEQFDGSFQTFERLRRADTVSIIATTADGKILTTLEQQPAKQAFNSVPGGRVEQDEDIIECAKRELKEETGYTSNDYELWFIDTPFSKIDWSVIVLIARNCQLSGPQQLDSGEKIEVKPVIFEEFVNLVLTQQLHEPGIHIKLLHAKLNNNLADIQHLFFKKDSIL